MRLFEFVTNRLKAFLYAWKGVVIFFTQERSALIHGLAAIVVVLAGFYFDVSATEWLVLILTIALVISMEIMNTAVEEIVDLFHPEQDPKAGKIKDIAAGAVFVTAAAAIVVALIIFLPKIL